MSLTIEDTNPFEGLWRSSAMEKVPYTEDFPEALLVTPEFWDGAVGQGKATTILTKFEELSPGKWKLTVRDNGVGIKNERRLLGWAASKSTDLLHQNGHGTKKALTKYARNYNNAVWNIKWRRLRKNLQNMSAPFKGIHTNIEEIEEKEENENENVEENENDEEIILMPSGTEITIEFDSDVLGRLEDKPNELADAIRELITTRYSEEIIQRIEFTVEVITLNPLTQITINSRTNSWHSFQWHVEAWTQKSPDQIVRICEHRELIDGGYWDFVAYLITMSGQQKFELKDSHMFPTYGNKNMKGSRAHISLNGRMIEPIPIHKIMKNDGMFHNNYNGMIWFSNFVPNTPEDYINMPSPSTTKVSFYENDPVMREFYKTVKEKYEEGLTNFEKIQETERLKALESRRLKEKTVEVKATKVKPTEVKSVELTPKKKKTPITSSTSSSPSPVLEGSASKYKPSKKFRATVWDKYIGKELAYHLCLCCKRTKIMVTEFHCGHIISEKERPDLAQDIGNIRPICAGCNFDMGTTNMIDYVKAHGYYVG